MTKWSMDDISLTDKTYLLSKDVVHLFSHLVHLPVNTTMGKMSFQMLALIEHKLTTPGPYHFVLVPRP